MPKELPRKLQVPQLRIRSITAGFDALPYATTGQSLSFSVTGVDGDADRVVTIRRHNGAGAGYGDVQVHLADLMALAALESDHPHRAPYAEPAPRLTAPPPKREARRVVGMLAAVSDLMKDGQWWTLKELQADLKARKGRHHELPAISARIRDMRKPEFGGQNVERKSTNVDGLYRYRLVPRQ